MSFHGINVRACIPGPEKAGGLHLQIEDTLSDFFNYSFFDRRMRALASTKLKLWARAVRLGQVEDADLSEAEIRRIE